jgi:hypothetical protein
LSIARRSIRDHRLFLALLLALCLSGAAPARAAGGYDDHPPLDAQAIAQLAEHAETAKPREQAFLYSELAHSLTELAGHQLRDGNGDVAKTLARIRDSAASIRRAVAANPKRLQAAEMLLDHTTARLTEILHHASLDDKPELQATLQQLTTAHDDVLNEVMRH